MSGHDHEFQPLPQRITDAAAAGCESSRQLINRRAFMGLSASLSAWTFMPCMVHAASADPRLLVVVLRGGMDGLHMVAPVGDPSYNSARQSLALPVNDSWKLGDDSIFQLHPAMPNLYTMFKTENAAIVHAVAPPLRIRSHFHCQDNLESGLPGNSRVTSQTSGWMNKLLSCLTRAQGLSLPRGLQVGPAPLIMAGKEPVASWGTGAFSRKPDGFDARLTSLYESADKNLHDLLSRGLSTHQMAIDPKDANPKDDDAILIASFAGAGRLMKNELGPRIATLSVEGWDTHVSQERTLTARLGLLDRALHAFRTSIGNAWSQTVVVCVTEFGRSVSARNIDVSAGTDHGIGTVALLMGGAVQGGIVHGKWPGLGESELADKRDLRATTDLRSVFKGVIEHHLGVSRRQMNEKIFEGSDDIAPMQGLIKG